MPSGYDPAMEFHQLRYFVAAAELGSISAAARREHVTQPALSRQVARLETQLAVPLFRRVKQRIELTDAGRFFLPRARQILCDAATTEQQLRESFGKAKRTLRLGFLSPFLDDLVTPVVRELKKRHRTLQVALFDLPPRAQLERLAAGELDAALVANLDPQHRQQFALQRLSRHRLAAALPEGHRLAGRATLALAELRDENWVSLSDVVFPGRREFLRHVCAEAGFVPRIVQELDSVSLMLGAVAVGEGVAVVPMHSRKLPHAGCAFVRLQPPAPCVELQLVTRRDGDADLGALAAALHRQAEQIAER
ncbi:MAG: LysR family transcriptional regulator [Planctomycetes bacterium]|nr:LysR family transcriptional regulator [Planctomycetota bacterium]